MEGYYVMVININLGSILLCTIHDDIFFSFLMFSYGFQ
jgi:hypothetical protein